MHFRTQKRFISPHPIIWAELPTLPKSSEICRRNGLLLLVDNAHGAALVLSEQQHPMTLGADLCCDSAHKTLPVFTGGAFLHLSDGFSADALKDKMALFGSTSPSYLIMLSIELCMEWLKEEGKAAYLQTARQIKCLKEQCRSKKIPIIDGPSDPFRLSLSTGAAGYPMTGQELIFVPIKLNRNTSAAGTRCSWRRLLTHRPTGNAWIRQSLNWICSRFLPSRLHMILPRSFSLRERPHFPFPNRSLSNPQTAELPLKLPFPVPLECRL